MCKPGRRIRLRTPDDGSDSFYIYIYIYMCTCVCTPCKCTCVYTCVCVCVGAGVAHISRQDTLSQKTAEPTAKHGRPCPEWPRLPPQPKPKHI